MLNVLNDDINNSREEYKVSFFISFPRPGGSTFISLISSEWNLHCIVHPLLSSCRHLRRLNCIVASNIPKSRSLLLLPCSNVQAYVLKSVYLRV
jgi:hypothetical protein